MSTQTKPKDGYWHQVFTGKSINVLSVLPEDISIIDIAHGLSHMCRWNGNCERFYSVAEHSVLVSLCVPQHVAGKALLHDAAEAYLGDCITPIKAMLPDFHVMEERLSTAIYEKYGVVEQDYAHIKMWDQVIGKSEARTMMKPTRFMEEALKNISCIASGMPIDFKFMSPEEAKLAFLDRAGVLGLI